MATGAIAVAASAALVLVYFSRSGAVLTQSESDNVVSLQKPNARGPQIERNDGLQTIVSSSNGLVIPIANEPEYTIVRYVPASMAQPENTFRNDKKSDPGDLP